MHAIDISAPGGPDVLNLISCDPPTPAAGEVLIKVEAAGVNRPDVLQRMGLYPPPENYEGGARIETPGLEVAGVVEALGPDTTGVSVGDAVCALLPGGGYAEYAVAPAGSCMAIPRGLSATQAAGLPETVMTVWANVFDDARLQPGETLLVHGGTSGIGATAIGLAKAFDARVVATAGSAAKVAASLELGADEAFHYEDHPWDERIRDAGGANVVLDMAGGDFIPRNIAAMAPGGRHVSIAFLRGPEGRFNIFDVMRRRLRLSGSTLKARDEDEKARLAAAVQQNVWPLIAEGRFGPRVDRTFPLAEAAAAHAYMEAGDHIGKIILTTS